MITLQPVTEQNFYEVIGLKVADSQKGFVASNTFSIAESKVQPECIPLAVYEENTLVGFVMYCMDRKDNEYWIYRIMTDEKFQSKGYGRSAMSLLISKIKEDKDHHVIYISFEPENIWAKSLYESLGFEPDGRIDGSEIVYKYTY